MFMIKCLDDLGQCWADHNAWIIGFILIGFNSYKRFNTPPTSRSSTTWGRYHTAAVVYVAVTLVGWIVLARTPGLLAYIVDQANLSKEFTQFTAPLYTALTLTVLISSFKPFQDADEKLRIFFQDLARIPWEAKRLSDALRTAIWSPTPLLQTEVCDALRTADFNEHDISFSGDRSPQARWTKISALHYQLNKWQSWEQRRFANFYYQHQIEFQKLSDDYDALAAEAKRLFRLLDTLQSMPGDPKLAQIQEELIDGFMAGAARLEKDICDLTSRALLKCTLTEGSRREKCEAMGFVVNIAHDPTFDRLLLLYFILAGTYMTVLSLAGRPHALLTGAIVGTNYIGAVLSALYLKRWSWARPTEAGKPIRGYVLSGVIAFGLATVVSCGLGVLRTGDIKETVDLFLERWWPWSLMAAFMAAVTAFNLDNGEWPRRRWFEAASQAAVGVAGAFFVYVQLERLCTATAASDPNCVLPSLVRVMLLAAVSGGVIGWFVPTWYRESQSVTIHYRGCKVIVTVKVLSDGYVTPTIRMIRLREWGQPHSADGRDSPLPFEGVFQSVEEALARAVEYARKQIDISLKVMAPVCSSAA